MSQIEPLFISNRRIFIRGLFVFIRLSFIRVLKYYVESSSRIYSPYVFAVGQLIGEIPYNVMCALLYWVLMVCLVALLSVLCSSINP